MIKKAVIGLSGGVDSAVAAILMKEAGWDVVGVNMRVHPSQESAIADAKAVAEHLSIPFYSIDLISDFKAHVASYLSSEYLLGRTPNPCVICNQRVKFGHFWEQIEALIGEFDCFATGHYANICQLENGRWTIEKGVDEEKDQAYFLSMLSQEQIQKAHFPLFGLQKYQVREIAATHGLFNSKKSESQDLCTGSYLEHIKKGSGEGDFIEQSTGKVVGRHLGIENYTVGQRRGLNIGIGYPLFVLRIDKLNNQVIVGNDDELLCDRMFISAINWVGVHRPQLPWAGGFKIRYRDSGAMARLIGVEERGDVTWGEIKFDAPVRAITPGQLAVAYDGNKVAFSGFIEPI